MSAWVPEDERHRTDLGTKAKIDATLIRIETDSGLTGTGAALGTPPVIAAIVGHELAAGCVGEDPMFSARRRPTRPKRNSRATPKGFHHRQDACGGP
jgi:L-alanine-DL-glutamate epimerase-like enolase superfamily enzyme